MKITISEQSCGFLQKTERSAEYCFPEFTASHFGNTQR